MTNVYGLSSDHSQRGSIILSPLFLEFVLV